MTTQTELTKPTKPTRRPTVRKSRISAKNRAALRLLDSLMNCSEEEARDQQETFDFLKKALDEDRPGYRKLFPENANEADGR